MHQVAGGLIRIVCKNGKLYILYEKMLPEPAGFFAYNLLLVLEKIYLYRYVRIRREKIKKIFIQVLF